MDFLLLRDLYQPVQFFPEFPTFLWVVYGRMLYGSPRNRRTDLFGALGTVLPLILLNIIHTNIFANRSNGSMLCTSSVWVF